MRTVQIVARGAPNDVIDVVERAFSDAGIETALHVFGTDPDRNAVVAVELAEGQGRDRHPTQVWVVPSSFLELDRRGREKADAARARAGFPPAEDRQERLFVTLGRCDARSPDRHVAVEDLASGAVAPEVLRSWFEPGQ